MKAKEMRVTGIGQENRPKSACGGYVKAGVAGGAAGAFLCKYTPMTTEEYADFFTPSAKEEIKKAAKSARIAEIEKISQKAAGTNLDVNSSIVMGKFNSMKEIIAENPKKALDFIENSPDAVKSRLKALIDEVDKAGLAKQKHETAAIKSAAKGSRSFGYFALAGAFAALSTHVIYSMINSKPQKENNASLKEPLRLADALLEIETPGANTEMRIFSNQVKKRG